MTRSIAWSPVGKRAICDVPGGRWANYNVIAGIGVDGLRAPMIISGAIYGTVMLAWVERCLVPKLHRGDIVIWDNLSIHTDVRLKSAIERRGAKLVFLPPYSPDPNPIEMAWSKLKAIL